MPRKGENIYKRKDGRWEGRYIKSRRAGGKAIYGYIYAKSYKEVKTKLIKVKAENKQKMQEQIITYNQIEFSQLVESWIQKNEVLLKESTLVKYKNILNSYILPVMGPKRMNEITYKVIEEFYNQLLITGGRSKKGLAPKTVADIMSLFRNILKYVADFGIQPACDAKLITVKQTPKSLRVLSKKEQEQLCQYLYENLNLRNTGILICLFTGIRIGEICALKWEDIMLEESKIYIHKTMQRIQKLDGDTQKTKVIITSPKSIYSIRTIPLPDNLVKIISNLKENQKGYFLTGIEEKYLEPRTMQNHFKAILRNCGIQNVNFHVLRHTFATRCIELNFDVKSLSEILGHANVNITMNRYVHPSMELKQENMQKLSSLLTVK